MQVTSPLKGVALSAAVRVTVKLYPCVCAPPGRSAASSAFSMVLLTVRVPTGWSVTVTMVLPEKSRVRSMLPRLVLLKEWIFVALEPPAVFSISISAS